MQRPDKAIRAMCERYGPSSSSGSGFSDEMTGTAGACSNCGAAHSPSAAYCAQCGEPLLEDALAGPLVSESVS